MVLIISLLSNRNLIEIGIILEYRILIKKIVKALKKSGISAASKHTNKKTLNP